MSEEQCKNVESGPLPERVMQGMRPEAIKEAPTTHGAIICHILLLESVLERTANRVTEAHQLTFPQWMALGCIGSSGQTGITHSELSRRLMLSKAPITGVVDRLQRAKYVRRVTDHKDRRVSRIVITDEGLQHWSNVRLDFVKHSDELFGEFSKDDCDCLLTLLARLLKKAAHDDPTLTDLNCVADS